MTSFQHAWVVTDEGSARLPGLCQAEQTTAIVGCAAPQVRDGLIDETAAPAAVPA